MGSKVVLYSAFMANGECWPPVLFTNKPLPDQGSSSILRLGQSDQFAFVHYLPKSKSASTKHTEIWLEDMNSDDANMLQGRHHLLLDKAKWHTSAEARKLFGQYDITTHYIPAATGRWLDPCDQAIHRELRRSFRKRQRVRRSDKLQNIVRAYYDISEKTVLGSWRRTALLEGDAKAHLTKVSTEGYRAPKGREAQFQLYSKKFDLWANSSLGSRDVADADPSRVGGVKRGLDGAYWSFIEPSRKRRVGGGI
jgi:hypothetical protein